MNIVAQTHENHAELLDEQEIIKWCIASYNFYLNYVNTMNAEIKIKSPLDYLDNRKGYLTMFKYCPNSGNLIDWKKIKDDLKKEIC